VALFATLIGVVLGAALPFVIAYFFGAILPLPVEPAVQPGVLALSIAYGILTALAFSLWPLGRAHDISVSMLFRDQVAGERSWPRARYRRERCDRRHTCGACRADHLRSPHRGVFPRRSGRRVRAVAPGCRAGDGDGEAVAAPELHRAAACYRQYSSRRCIDSECDAVARARARDFGDHRRDRGQSASGIRRRAAGQSAVVLLPRHSGGADGPLRCLHHRSGAWGAAVSGADAEW